MLYPDLYQEEPVSMSGMANVPGSPLSSTSPRMDRRRSSLWTLYNYSVDDYLNQNPQSMKDQCMFVLVVLGFIVSGVCFVISGPIFCLFKLTRMARLVILWLWLVLVAILLSLSLRFGLFTGSSTTLALGDSRPVVGGMKPLFCDAGIARSLDEMTVHMTNGVPELSANISQSTVQHTWTLVQSEHKTKRMYLLEGSTMNMTLNLTPDSSNIVFYLIKGYQNLKAWEADRDCACYIEKREVKNNDKINQLIFNRDDYYIVFDYPNPGTDIQLDITLTLHRTQFDFSQSNKGCISTYCTFTFSAFSSDVMIVTAPDQWRSIGVTSECSPRALTYVLFFIVLPLVLGIGMSLIIFCFCNQEDDVENFPILSRLGSYSDYGDRRGSRRQSGFKTIFEQSGMEDTTESSEDVSTNQFNESSGRVYNA